MLMVGTLTAAQPAAAAPNAPHVEGLTLGMAPDEVARASRRPCRPHPFLPDAPCVLCAVPADPDTSLAVGLTWTNPPGRVFALLLRFCSRRSFPDLVGDVRDRYHVDLGTRSALSDQSRGAQFGRGLILALSQDGTCANGAARFGLLLADQGVFASEQALPAARTTDSEAPHPPPP